MEKLNILIIEDEKPAADKLLKLISQYNLEFNLLGILVSIQESVSFLQNHNGKIDLIFLDIQLIDGQSFSIFDRVAVTSPVIFTTAYDEYALKAFKLNSIDYILKPYTYIDVENALNKFSNLKEMLNSGTPPFDYGMLKKLIEEKPQYKDRFMVKKGEKLKVLDTNCIKLFYADDRDVYLLSDDNRRYDVNQKLEEVEKVLDPKQFYRVSRTFIVNFKAIVEIIAYSNSRLKIDVDFKWDKEIIVSREKVTDFKRWMAGDQ